jgi:hypothetical protein
MMLTYHTCVVSLIIAEDKPYLTVRVDKNEKS